MTALEQIEAFIPQCPQEAAEKPLMLDFLRTHADAFSRENLTAHMTASAWVVSPDGERVAMCWHNLYRSWSWSGGHADGDEDLLAVAMREAEEELGVKTRPVQEGIVSLEILPVAGHMKHGAWVPSHLHMNVTYLLQAQSEELRCRPEENSAVGWMTPGEALASSTEPWMVERVYRKLTAAAQRLLCPKGNEG